MPITSEPKKDNQKEEELESREEMIVRHSTSGNHNFMECIFPLLMQVGFAFHSGSPNLYSLGNRSFETEETVRLFLVENGIPQFEFLDEIGKEWLTVWVTHAHAKRHDYKTVNVDEEPFDNIQTLLQEKLMLTIQEDENDMPIFYSQNSDRLGTLQEVRSLIRARGLDSLFAVRPSARPRRISSILPSLEDTEQAKLRLWAARSPSPLPAYSANQQ